MELNITQMEKQFDIFWVKSNYNVTYNHNWIHHHHLLFFALVRPFDFQYLHLTNHIHHHLFHCLYCYICQYYNLYLLIDFILLILSDPHHLISCYTQCLWCIRDNIIHTIEFILDAIFVVLLHLSPILLTMLHFDQWCNLGELFESICIQTLIFDVWLVCSMLVFDSCNSRYFCSIHGWHPWIPALLECRNNKCLIWYWCYTWKYAHTLLDFNLFCPKFEEKKIDVFLWFRIHYCTQTIVWYANCCLIGYINL